MRILGIKIDNLNFQETLFKIEEFIKEKKPHQIVTINPEFVMKAQKDKEFFKILNEADLALPDGVGIIWASKILRNLLKERIPGVDLVWKIVKLCSKKGYSIFLLGAKEGVAKKCQEILQDKYKNLKIVGAISGGKINESLTPYPLPLITRIQNAHPDILLVAFGAPKQDKFIYRNKEKLNIPVMIGVGGTFNYISGRAKRAPDWLCKIGLEWFYRLLRQPSRIKRQLVLLKFICSVLKEKLKIT